MRLPRLPLLPVLDRFAAFGEPDADAVQRLMARLVSDCTFARRPDGSDHAPVESGTIMMESAPVGVAIAFVLVRGPGHPTTLKTVYPLVADPAEIIVDITDRPVFPPREAPALIGDIVIAPDRALQIGMFDTHKITTWPPVLRGQRWRVRVAGIALHLKRFAAEPIPLSAETASRIGVAPQTLLRTDAMTAWLPSDHIADVVQIVGHVTATDEIYDSIEDRMVYRISITISRENGDVTVPVVITRYVLGDQPLPWPGEQVEALVWLQARAVSPLPVTRARGGV